MGKICNLFSQVSKFAVLECKNFDKTAPLWLIDAAFDILLENIDSIYYEDHGEEDLQRMIMFFYIKKYLIETVIKISTDDRYLNKSGIGSGSYFI
jgi:hypothetical protein